MEAASHTAAGVHEHHEHMPEANVSSRVEAQFLGMLLFIISEIMLFGAFFTAYFFIRVVNGDQWFPVDGHSLPVSVAAVNTCILLSSSFTMHWTLESARNENRRALQVGILTTFLLGLTFLSVQINEYVHLGFAPSDSAQATVFYCLTGLHGCHVFVGLTLLLMVTIRAFRGHFSAKEHRGVEVPGIYWHFVDIMWIFVFSTLYVL
ncbi:MAG TPA: heme-copper oxidase subunit III [Thermoleophilaceae bacterium]